MSRFVSLLDPFFCPQASWIGIGLGENEWQYKRHVRQIDTPRALAASYNIPHCFLQSLVKRLIVLRTIIINKTVVLTRKHLILFLSCFPNLEQIAPRKRITCSGVIFWMLQTYCPNDSLLLCCLLSNCVLNIVLKSWIC